MGMTWLTAEWFMISRHDPSDHNVLRCILHIIHHYTLLYIIIHYTPRFDILLCTEVH